MSEAADPLTDTCARRFPNLPGLWEDAHGAMHFSIAEFHAAHGIPNTPEQIAETREIFSAMLAKAYPDTSIVFREKALISKQPLS